ncbi:Protein argonaute-3, partial [Orchesella cincta]
MDLSQDLEGFVPISGIGTGRGRGRGFRAAMQSDSRPAFEVLSVDKNPPPPNDDDKLEDETQNVFQDSQKITQGTNGTRCECLTNFVQLTKDKDVPVYEYQVAFSEALESTNLKKNVMKQLVRAIGPVNNFDGQILYLPKRLPNDATIFTCSHPTTPAGEVKVTIKFTTKKEFKDLGPFYTILFKRIMLCLGFTEIRKGFYEAAEVRVLKQHKLQVWPGVSLTVDVKEGGLMLMIDSPNRILREDTIKAMRERDHENFHQTFSDFAIGQIVLCGYSNQCYKIDDISWDINPLSEFKEGLNLITYKDYFKKKYGVTVKDLNQPMLISTIKPRKRYNPDEAIRMVSLVPELCYLTGLTSDQRQNYKIATEIQTITNLNPQLKINSMRALLTKILRSTIAKKIFKDWGIGMDADVKSLIARKIDGPKLAFKKDTKEKLVQDDFSNDASKSCYEPVDVGKFLILCTKHDVAKARAFENYYKQACNSVGIRVRSFGTIVPVTEYQPSSYIKALEENCDPATVQFVIAIMPSYSDDVYAAVKSFCLTSRPVPLPSQCILSKTLGMRSIQTLAMKICLQINCKIGGSLWALKMPVKNIMILGMDVAHDVSRRNPSVIALIASMNDTCTKYYSKSGFQRMHQEVAVGMRVLFMDALQAYKENNNGELPDRIVFFRDGGNAETFDVLKRYEVDVCVEVLTREYVEQRNRSLPAFSYICVAKHFPERIFLVTEGNNIINPLPGTIVDNTITQPFLYDFFCVSQKTRQGTLNPTHYTVLYETIPTKPDLMQQIAYSSTFVYYNWQGSVRVPAVIQYAHKLGKLISRAKINPCELNEAVNSTLYYL